MIFNELIAVLMFDKQNVNFIFDQRMKYSEPNQQIFIFVVKINITDEQFIWSLILVKSFEVLTEKSFWMTLCSHIRWNIQRFKFFFIFAEFCLKFKINIRTHIKIIWNWNSPQNIFPLNQIPKQNQIFFHSIHLIWFNNFSSHLKIDFRWISLQFRSTVDWFGSLLKL